jgi:hypothetical protein
VSGTRTRLEQAAKDFQDAWDRVQAALEAKSRAEADSTAAEAAYHTAFEQWKAAQADLLTIAAEEPVS